MFKKNLKHLLSNKRITRIGADLLYPSVVVLMYHDLCEDRDFPSWLRVKKSHFESQVSQLQEICTFIRPSDLFRGHAMSNHHLNILLTFDDGFINQYHYALPIIKKFSIPALFFISTENIQSGEIFWFDKIITPIQAKRIDHLDLRFLGLDNYHFPLNNEIQRWESIEKLLNEIKEKTNAEKYNFAKILNYFDDTFKDTIQMQMEKYRPLAPKEILKMKESSICYFGSHSHRHEILTYLENEDIRNNLIDSKTYLEALLVEPITHISYPNGNVNQTVEMLCKEAGYDYGYTIKSGVVRKYTNHMQIPRIAVSGYDTIPMLFWKINKAMIKTAMAS